MTYITALPCTCLNYNFVCDGMISSVLVISLIQYATIFFSMGITCVRASKPQLSTELLSTTICLERLRSLNLPLFLILL